MGNNGEFIFWDDNVDEYGGFFTPQDFQNNQIFQAANQSLYADDSLSNRIMLSPESNHNHNVVHNHNHNQNLNHNHNHNHNHNQPEVEEDRLSQSSPPLGLTLRKTPSFLSLVQSSLSKGKQHAESSDNAAGAGQDNLRLRRRMDDVQGSQSNINEKLKASNFPAFFIRIGSWQRLTRHEGDLTAKLYYAKKKLVWEVLEGALKSKIEIQWSDISAIQAITIDNEPGILQIELSQPPLFYREINPQPRKHTLWQQASDFTGGQAPIFRRHYVRFPPGILDKHYEKLLLCDQRLYELSKKSFPSHESPYFDPTIYGISQLSHIFNTFGSNDVQYPSYNAYPPAPLPRQIPHSTIVPPAMDYPYTNDGGNMQMMNHQFAAAPPHHAPPPPPPNTWGEVVNHGFQADHQQHYHEPNIDLLSDIEQHLLGEAHVVPFNESPAAPVETMNPWMGPMDFSPPSYNIGHNLNMNMNMGGGSATQDIPVMQQMAPANYNYNHNHNYNQNYNYNYNYNDNNANVVVTDQQAAQLYSQHQHQHQHHVNWHQQMPPTAAHHDDGSNFFMEQQPAMSGANSLPPYYFHGNNPTTGGFY